MREITVGNLLQLEPRLGLIADSVIGAPEHRAREISWAVSIRSTPPHLPALRGGELLLLGKSAIDGVGHETPALLREAVARGASGIILAAEDNHAFDLDVGATVLPRLVWDGSIGPEVESGLNRLLTGTRGELYRIGSELERRIADATVQGTGVEALAHEVERLLGAPVHLRFKEGSGSETWDRRIDAAGSSLGGESVSTIAIPLANGAALEVGPGSAVAIIAAGVFRDRIAAALTEALHRERAARPRGEQHAATLAALVCGTVGDDVTRRALARTLGLDAGSQFLVMLASSNVAADLGRQWAAIGTVSPAGSIQGRLRYVVAISARMESDQIKRRIEDTVMRMRNDGTFADQQLAISAAVTSIDELPRAASQANLLAALQSRWWWLPSVAMFDSPADVGPLELLDFLRESGRLQAFVAQSLGRLLRDDRRGTLRKTMTRYLECGGSQIDAAARLEIHRNTLAYRLRRAAELVGRDVTDPRFWVSLHLALLGADLLEVTGGTDGSRGHSWT
ncbi:MAG: helix-turn-helix domain-containing protein [Thermomicrobiales bacterium]